MCFVIICNHDGSGYSLSDEAICVIFQGEDDPVYENLLLQYKVSDMCGIRTGTLAFHSDDGSNMQSAYQPA